MYDSLYIRLYSPHDQNPGNKLYFWIQTSYLDIPYFYLTAGIVLGIIPISIVLFEYPRLIAKFFKTAAYFFYLNFAYEITALKLGIWDFPGDQFIGWVTFFGMRFPFEEFFFWIILGAIAMLSYYEFFDDDRK